MGFDNAARGRLLCKEKTENPTLLIKLDEIQDKAISFIVMEGAVSNTPLLSRAFGSRSVLELECFPHPPHLVRCQLSSGKYYERG